MTSTTMNATVLSITITESSLTDTSEEVDIMMIIRLILSSVGIIGNLNVLIVFLNHKKFRQKIPNIFIIHQVSGSKFIKLHGSM